MLAPISWRVPPRHYGPWEQVVSLLTEGLVKRGVDVTLFATADSVTSAHLVSVCPRAYSEDPSIDAKVWESLHISAAFERAEEFDLIHNHFDFLPLSYSQLVRTPLVTTIHGFSSERILPVYEKYNGSSYYIAISNADRSPRLNYLATIHHGIKIEDFTFRRGPGDYLLFFGRIHPEKGAAEAIRVAKRAKLPLIIAGIIQDAAYFEKEIAPEIDDRAVRYLGSVGPKRRGELLAGARALLHLIDFREPFGLSVVEAMACGTPVIARPLGAVPEIVSDGQTGFLVDSCDAAVEAVERVGELDRGAIRRHVEEKFSADRMVDEYLRAYQTLLSCDERRHKSATPEHDERPWGSYTVLNEGDGYKVKRIEVLPGKRLSYQKHSSRQEHWMIVHGTGTVTVDGREIVVQPGDSAVIPVRAAHRIANSGEQPLVFIEIQRGSYLGEDDIIRLQDDFGRVPEEGVKA
jgi:mannose-6-phosphate isomerase-like protein (cupin superfamily)/glycosyltransferase involved in cell wall biosynthesis